MDTITRVLAKELGGRNIRVNAINPGMIETEGTRAQGIIGSDFEKNVLAQTPLGRIGQPDDVAKVAVFLASDGLGLDLGRDHPGRRGNALGSRTRVASGSSRGSRRALHTGADAVALMSAVTMARRMARSPPAAAFRYQIAAAAAWPCWASTAA